MTKQNTNNRGTGFAGLLTVLFVGLKLTGYIEWSWLWVLSPIWISVGLVVFISLIVLILAIFSNKKRKGK